MTDREAKLATVLAMGPGKLIADRNEYVPPRLSVGDVVYLNIHAGNKIGVPDDYDFVVLGAGGAVTTGQRCRWDEATQDAVLDENGPDLMLNRGAKLQLQTEDAVYMKVV
jgi:hypothetical protein